MWFRVGHSCVRVLSAEPGADGLVLENITKVLPQSQAETHKRETMKYGETDIDIGLNLTMIEF